MNIEQFSAKLQAKIEQIPHPSIRGNLFRVYQIEQVPAQAPTFIFHVNFPNDVRNNYRSFLENEIRKLYDFSGVPLNL
ncbi:MAG: hypothetical protein ACHQD9_04435, partial [Chitinophagales bacterium]